MPMHRKVKIKFRSKKHFSKEEATKAIQQQQQKQQKVDRDAIFIIRIDKV